MSKTPGESSGSSSFAARPYSRPGRALLIAGVGLIAAVLVLTAYPALRTNVSGAPGGVLALLDIALINLPLVLAVLAAGVLATTVGVARATGIHSFAGSDLLLGVSVALVVRGLVEVVTPTTGSLVGPLGAPDVLATAVAIVGIVLVSPFVEEWFFRGLVLRAIVDALTGTRGIAPSRLLVGGTAVVVSTGAFAALHFVTLGGAVPLSLLLGTVGVGVGCGILTVVTGRLGAALTAHVTFNALGVALLLL